MLGAAPGSLPPAGTPNYFVSESQVSFSFEVRTFSTSNNYTTGTFTVAPVSVSQSPYDTTFDGNPIIVPQAGTTTKLNTLEDRLLQKVPYRRIGSAESLWVVHSVMATPNSTVLPQWAQIDVSGGTISATAVQQQIYAPDSTLYRWIGSLSVDKDGNMALGYSTSSSSTYPSIAYSGRFAANTPGTLSQSDTQVVVGEGAETNTCGGTACDGWETTHR